MSDDIRDMFETDEDFIHFQNGDVVEYIGDSYCSVPRGSLGNVVDVFPVEHGVAYAVTFLDCVLESYVCFDGEIRRISVGKTKH